MGRPSDGSGPLRVTYLVRAGADEIETRAETLMLEQTVELPRSALADRRLADRVVGRVEAIEPAGSAAAGKGCSGPAT